MIFYSPENSIFDVFVIVIVIMKEGINSALIYVKRLVFSFQCVWYGRRTMLKVNRVGVMIIIFQKLIFVRTSIYLWWKSKALRLCLTLPINDDVVASTAHICTSCTIMREMFEIYSLKEKTTCQNKSFSFYQCSVAAKAAAMAMAITTTGSIKGWESEKRKQEHDVKFSSSCLLVCMQCNRKIK